jgi:hypothetical protein
MANYIGKSGFGSQTWSFPYGKPPQSTVVYYGTQSECNFSGSIYFALGWNVEYTQGNPFVMTATINRELQSDGKTPVTGIGSYPTTQYELNFDMTTKDILHVKDPSVSWFSQIDDKDKATLDNIISSPLQFGDFGYSGASGDGGVNWSLTSSSSLFSGSNATSVSASQVVYTMAMNGSKDMDIYIPTLRYSITVPLDYSLSTFYTNVDRIYVKSSVNTEISIPSNRYSQMPQASDPSNIAIAGRPSAGGIPYHYGWRKMYPRQTDDGTTLRMEQIWVYGLWPQNIYGVTV